MDDLARASERETRAAALAGAVAAGLALALGWGFTVDDAWISARVAWNLAEGRGYAFNPGGPRVDAVTPLGWAHVLAPFAARGPAAAVVAARWGGATATVLATAWLGREVARLAGSRWRYAPLAVLAASLPFGAWAGAGMETGFVVALATRALGADRWALAAGGLAAAWRPELTPWAMTLAALRGERLAALGAPAAWRALAVLGPVLTVAAARLALFGSPLPLAVVAKPSDLAHGARYVAAASLHLGIPALAVAPGAWRLAPWSTRALGLACVAHAGALVLVGGDWMSLFRLAVPVLPGLTLAAASLAAAARPRATVLRVGIGAALAVRLGLELGPAARGVAAQRAELIEAVRPALVGARRVVALDVGWVGTAYTGELVDLAGVTDPEVAGYSGGHTSKRWPAGALARRDVDGAVLLLAPNEELATPWWRSAFAREVERRAAGELQARRVERLATTPLRGTGQRYVWLRFAP
ncbi:MAG: hypothetical protein IT376_18570 [Polyangiaceae bacterium]|nr:hypothetical protein [Polyangiaceae bacterium]